MANQIWKFPITDPSYVTLELPKGAIVLTIQMQHNVPCIWVLVNPEVEKETRYFKVIGTGHPIEDDLATISYINTFQMHGGDLVFHLFEKASF